VLIKEAQSLLIVIKTGPKGTLSEINEAVTTIQRDALEDTDVVFTRIIEEEFGDLFEVRLYAMGEPQSKG
jgi:cell division GTPase FtsZ